MNSREEPKNILQEISNQYRLSCSLNCSRVPLDKLIRRVEANAGSIRARQIRPSADPIYITTIG
jgi:hypothetical protein